jgi:hypothetical protein
MIFDAFSLYSLYAAKDEEQICEIRGNRELYKHPRVIVIVDMMHDTRFLNYCSK